MNKKIVITLISILSIVLIFCCGCISFENSSSNDIESIHLSIFTEDGQPFIPINYEVNEGIHENLTQSSFNVIVEIIDTDFYQEYNFKYNEKINKPELIPKSHINILRYRNKLYNFEFSKRYTFQIRLEINSSNSVINTNALFGEDNIVEGFFIVYDSTYDPLEYGSDDFDFNRHPNIGRDEIFRICGNLVFRIGIDDGGVACC